MSASTSTGPAYWWLEDARETAWMEIRERPGIGASLWAPDRDDNGDRNAWYDLVGTVRAGDTIYHYSTRERRFVGRSHAAQDGLHDPIAGSYSVRLTGFVALTSVVDLEVLRERADDLYRIRDELQAAHGSPLYLPFQYTNRRSSFRPMSNYFAKMPNAYVDLLFGSTPLSPVAKSPTGPPSPAPRGVSYLEPFKPKADTNYLVTLPGAKKVFSRRHETLVNNCAAWLAGLGFEPGRNPAVDLGLLEPSVIFEAKTISDSWASPIRAAVGQLYEYRYFKVADPAAALVFLSEKPVPDAWLRYLEDDRAIGAVWPHGDAWRMSQLARLALGM